MQEIRAFIEQLLVDKGITEIDDDVRNRLVDDMSQILMRQIDEAAINSLTDEQADELENKLGSGELADDDIPKFMEEKGLNLQQIALVTMMQFRDFYLGNVDVEGMKDAAENTNTEEKTEEANAQ